MNLMTIGLKLAAFGTAALMAVAAQAAITVHTTDFIPDASRTGFNGFESIPNDGTYFTGGAGPYSDGGITVEQINGDPPPDIWVTYRPPGSEGDFGWYPNGGDSGYTKITRTNGGDFSEVGMLVGSGFGGGPGPLLYELLKNGVIVGSGALPHSAQFHYLGFSGGGFDTILLADRGSPGSVNLRDGSENALTVDAIELGGGAPKTLAENIACARDLVSQLQQNGATWWAQRNMMNQQLANVLTYQHSYPSLAQGFLDAVILRTDGCALRQSPDTIFNQGGTGVDFVTNCNGQGAIYQCLIDARSQLGNQNGQQKN